MGALAHPRAATNTSLVKILAKRDPQALFRLYAEVEALVERRCTSRKSEDRLMGQRHSSEDATHFGLSTRARPQGGGNLLAHTLLYPALSADNTELIEQSRGPRTDIREQKAQCR
jgi:hypothetical protein